MQDPVKSPPAKSPDESEKILSLTPADFGRAGAKDAGKKAIIEKMIFEALGAPGATIEPHAHDNIIKVREGLGERTLGKSLIAAIRKVGEQKIRNAAYGLPNVIYANHGGVDSVIIVVPVKNPG